MTQVSRIKLKPEVEQRIMNLFSIVISDIKGRDNVGKFLDDFLSPVEKIILVKRLAIAVLIAKGNDYDNIRRTLRVTFGTISKMSLKMKYGNGSVKSIAEYIANSDYGQALIEEILGIFEPKRRTLAGEVYKKPIWEKKQKVQRLKKEI